MGKDSQYTADTSQKTKEVLFQETRKLMGQYELEVEENAQPVVHSPRRFPIALKGKVKQELQRLKDLGIITEVTQPTFRVSSLVIVHKPNGKIRVCIDPKDLHRGLRRSHYPTPTREQILPQLARAKVFSTVDVKNGFWHVELDEKILLSTTFNSSFGRYRWRRLTCSRRRLHTLKGPRVYECPQRSWTEFACLDAAMSGTKCEA